MGVLRGDDLRQAFAAATSCLERYRDSINALNVFPVPDGDTGTNMLLTMRSALERCPETPGASAGDVLAGLADGAFWGARGNSGVILSQLFRGFADAAKGLDVCDGPGLDRAFLQAAEAAYASVANPVEGTMLSVMRAASIAGQNDTGAGQNDTGAGQNDTGAGQNDTGAGHNDTGAGQNDTGRGEEKDPLILWERAFHAACEALYITPSQLQILAEAGVVDAGGMGVVVILGGAVCALTGRDTSVVDQAVASYCVEPATSGGGYREVGAHSSNSALEAALETTLETAWGYCVQYVIEGSNLDVEEVKKGISPDAAQSGVVVGGGRLVRVHVHAPDPGPPLSYGASWGELDQINIENMNRQNSEYVAGHLSGRKAQANLAVVAVTPGDGLARLFQDAGCLRTIEGGQTMNPSVQQILDAAAAAGADDVIILPNNANVVLAAQQATEANPRLHVVPSKTVPQGVTALLAYNPEGALEDNLRAMAGVLGDVVSLAVTQAVRPSTLGGVAVSAGQYIGLIEGDIVTCGDAPEAVLKSALDRVLNSADQIVTLYQGAQAEPQSADELRGLLELAVPGVQVDLIYGGQPHYHYLASVE